MVDARQILPAFQRQMTAEERDVMQAQVEKLRQDMAKMESELSEHRQEVIELQKRAVKRENWLFAALQARDEETKELKRTKDS